MMTTPISSFATVQERATFGHPKPEWSGPNESRVHSAGFISMPHRQPIRAKGRHSRALSAWGSPEAECDTLVPVLCRNDTFSPHSVVCSPSETV